MFLEEINKPVNNKKYLLNNLNNLIIEIDYFDPKGIIKRKNRIPLRYILNSKNNNNRNIV